MSPLPFNSFYGVLLLLQDVAPGIELNVPVETFGGESGYVMDPALAAEYAAMQASTSGLFI